jgi:hypothetical protein
MYFQFGTLILILYYNEITAVCIIITIVVNVITTTTIIKIINMYILWSSGLQHCVVLYDVTNVLGGITTTIFKTSESHWEWVDHTAVVSARDGDVGKRPCPCQWEQAAGKTLMEGIF